MALPFIAIVHTFFTLVIQAIHIAFGKEKVVERLISPVSLLNSLKHYALLENQYAIT
jgi:hypothetical protein